MDDKLRDKIFSSGGPLAYHQKQIAQKKKPWSFSRHMARTTKTTWLTAKGETIKVKDMKDDHLVATVAFLRRVAPTAKIANLFHMLAGPRPSGDGATIGFESAIDELSMMSDDAFLLEFCPPFRAMLARLPKVRAKLEEEQRYRERECGV